MFLRTNGGLRAVGMIGEQHGTHGIVQLTHVPSQPHVVFLIDSLQFGMETTYHHIHKAVALNLGPVFQLVGRDILGIASHIERGISV